MAQVKRSPVNRVSPIKPGLTGARNWATAQIRAASYTRKGFMRLTLSIATVLLCVVFIGLWLGGFLPDIRQSGDEFARKRLMSMGFVVQRVDVMGEGRLNEAEVRESLGVYTGDYIFDVNMTSAQTRIESLSWVDHAVVRRLWPNRIVVQIVERRPYALWQNQGVIRVVDREGAMIIDAKVQDYAQLPLVVGEQAAGLAADFYNTIAQYPVIAPRVKAAIHMNGHRWDMHIARANGTRLTVALPRDNMDAALRLLSRLQMEHDVFEREMDHIDLRLPDRITLTPREAQRRSQRA